MNMIEEIKKTLKMEIRPNSEGKEYLEAVIVKKDLNRLESLLKKHLGQVALESGKEPQLPEAVQKILDSLGGLWHGQSFFHKQKGDEVLFAALWPWESNPDKVTLKAGMRKLVSKKTGK